MASHGPFGTLFASLTTGKINRRQFIERSTALGVGAGVAIFCANAAQAAASGGSQNGFAIYGQGGGIAKAPDAGTANQTRGEGGELKLIQWQAPTVATTHVGNGTKDALAASLVLEPLMHYLEDGTLIPTLITEVPSVDNGLLAKDLKTVTYKLQPGVTWSDGEPLMAKDVVFTWKWITTPSNNALTYGFYAPIASVEATDDLTAVVTFKAPTATWFEPFSGSAFGAIYPAHKFKSTDDPNTAFQTAPVGTGPYKIDSFVPNDQVIYSINEHYREPNKPYFSKVNLKGGGDVASAARAVLQTGDYDFAWNLQLEPAVLEDMEKRGGKGKVVTVLGTGVERININFSDPNTVVDGQRSHLGTPHPIFSDIMVRRALNLAVPRDVIATQFYGAGQPPTANILTGSAAFTSKNTSWEYNLEKAGALLDEAGWTMDGNVRKKDGKEFAITYATNINEVRQKTQLVVKQAFTKLGIKVQLKQVDSGVFFDPSPGNEQNISHMYVDINMYTNGAGSPVPVSFMAGWYSGRNGSNIAQKENGWSGFNLTRYSNPDYDALYEQVLVETDIEQASALLIQMNDVLIDDVALIPEVNRSSDTYAISNDLRNENVMVGPGFEIDYWNIANWNRVSS